MFRPVSSRPDLVAQEHEILTLWRDRRTFARLRAQNAGNERWSFLDGPITANNPMGVHHAWGRSYKDLFQRFWAMHGRDQRYQNGFDCQGLWVEVNVERDLGFTSKRDIEDFGIAEFVSLCKQGVLTFGGSYFTFSNENNDLIWGFLAECHRRGWIYKGADTMPWCARCGTGLSQMEMNEGY